MLNVLGLFSGTGGFELGLQRAGMNIVDLCEIEPHCIKVLNRNFPNIKVVPDITTLHPEVNQYDVMCGGFPCSGVSIAGKNKGLLGDERSALWREYHRVINEGKPKYAIIENVNAILGRGLEIILQDLAEIGYDTAYTTFDSKYFGVPQRRRRVYLVAFRDGIAPDTDFFQLGERDSPEHQSQVELIDESFEWDFTQVGRVASPFAFFTRQRSDEFACKGVSSALMKRDYKDFTDLVLQDGSLRRVTPTERLLLQGYPQDWFDGCGLTTTQQYTCNGMTIPVVEHIGKLLVEYHEKNV